jgi:hypothetical protein
VCVGERECVCVCVRARDRERERVCERVYACMHAIRMRARTHTSTDASNTLIAGLECTDGGALTLSARP